MNKYWSLGMLISSSCWGLTFPIQQDSDIVGMMQSAIIVPNEKISDIARRFDIGELDILEANPGINRNNLPIGKEITIPTKFILPKGPRTGVVLNLAELRIYYYHTDGKNVTTHPVGIGRIGWRTPIGSTKITHKRENPNWRPPSSIRSSYLRRGKTLPEIVPPGPNNPLGEYAMNLSWPRFLIHGTNKPESVGLRSSSGCIRMYPEDIRSFYHRIPIGTQVSIMHQPYKLGKKMGKLYLEAHQPFTESYYKTIDFEQQLNDMIDEEFYRHKINWGHTKLQLQQTHGYPIIIDRKL